MTRKNFTPRTETIISPAESLNNLFGDGRTLIIELEKVGLEQALCESVVAGDRLGNVSGIVNVYLHSARPHMHAQTITIHRNIKHDFVTIAMYLHSALASSDRS